MLDKQAASPETLVDVSKNNHQQLIISKEPAAPCELLSSRSTFEGFSQNCTEPWAATSPRVIVLKGNGLSLYCCAFQIHLPPCRFPQTYIHLPQKKNFRQIMSKSMLKNRFQQNGLILRLRNWEIIVPYTQSMDLIQCSNFLFMLIFLLTGSYVNYVKIGSSKLNGWGTNIVLV